MELQIKPVKVDTLLQLARATVEEYISNNRVITIDENCLSRHRNEKAGAFVTIYKNGQLRGCIGTINPVRENLVEEVKANAISAAIHDPRFKPVQATELPELKYSVNVLMPPEPIDSVALLDPSKYGVIVASTANRRGLLLPRIEGIRTVHEQIYHAMAKGGIRQNEQIWLYRFETHETKEE